MLQKQFAEQAAKVLQADENILGLAVAGSWITDEIDEFSDLDLVIVTKQKIGGNKDKMMACAKSLGNFISGFTGEHVGEPRLLICLYDEPLLHVDLKFVTLEEFHSRIENPVILFERDKQLQNVLNNTSFKFPFDGYQWMEDRFWTWIHYMLLKTGRGEYFEAYDGFGFLRRVIFGPLLLIKNKQLPRGVRRIETVLKEKELKDLMLTNADYNRESILKALKNCVELYRKLRTELYHNTIIQNKKAEQRVMEYFEEIEKRK